MRFKRRNASTNRCSSRKFFPLINLRSLNSSEPRQLYHLKKKIKLKKKMMVFN